MVKSGKSPAAQPQDCSMHPPMPQTIRTAMTSKSRTAAQNAQPSKPAAAAQSRDSGSAVYIGGVCSDIKHHISGLGIDSCGKVQVLSNGSDWKSFKVEMSQSQIDTACDRQNWPDGLRGRPFHPKWGISFRQESWRAIY